MHKIKMSFLKIILLAILLILPLSANESKLTPITLQLQWQDQFEFAGFYAAKEKGFYKDIGLNVIFKPFNSKLDIIDEVLKGKAHYGLTHSLLISRYLNGDPLVFIANFFKHSPLVLVSQKEFTLPSHLKNKKIWGVSSQIENGSIMMMFQKFNIHQNDFQRIESNITTRIESFINGKIDAMSIFLTNEIYTLIEKGVAFNVINPSIYGVPSYDLNLFTSREELEKHPKRVADFRAASIKGWEYALSHQEEIIQLILKKYNTQHKSYLALKYEAEQIQDIMLPSLHPIGSIDTRRVTMIAEDFIELGLISTPKMKALEQLIYHAPPQDLKLNDQEKNYLQSSREITYCADPLWLPLSQIKKEGKDYKHIGLDADFITLFSKKLYHSFTLVPTNNWETSIRKAKISECDLLTFVTKTPLREEYFSFTKPLMKTPLVLVTKIDKPFTDSIEKLFDQVIGVVKGYAYKELVSYRYPQLKLIEIDNINEGLKDVENGKLYGLIDNLSVLGYAVEKPFLGGLKVSSILDINIALRYAVKKENSLLLSILNKTIDTIDEGSKQKIMNRWNNISFTNESYNYAILGKVSIIFLLFAILLFYHYFKIKNYNKKLQKLSNKDELSDLYNRRYIDKHIIENQNNNIFSLILVDIDNFKLINDKYGHSMGDNVIKEIAKILHQHVRSGDIVSRWGGEEYLILCPKTKIKEAYTLAEHLRQTINNTTIEEGKGNVTCSFGVAEYPKEKYLDNEYLHCVDHALYQAKKEGKNRVVSL